MPREAVAIRPAGVAIASRADTGRVGGVPRGGRWPACPAAGRPWHGLAVRVGSSAGDAIDVGRVV